MKKSFFHLFFCAAALTACLASCNPDKPERFVTLTFEDADYHGVSSVHRYWSSLIDSPQYNGPQLYAAKAYGWYDDGNTWLRSEGVPQDFDKGLYGFSGGGIAISNYVAADVSSADYLSQLTLWSKAGDGKGGHNGSANFAVVYDGFSCKPYLEFADGRARVIDHLYVANTAYTANFLLNGDSFNAAMASDGYYEATATGFKADGTSVNVSKRLAEGSKIVSEWTEWDLSSLGAVVRVEFTVSGSADLYGAYGFNAPTYFAIDDIVVVKSEE